MGRHTVIALHCTPHTHGMWWMDWGARSAPACIIQSPAQGLVRPAGPVTAAREETQEGLGRQTFTVRFRRGGGV